MEASVGRRIAVLVVAMFCTVPLIVLVAGVVRVRSAAEDSGNTQGSERTYVVLYKQQAVPTGSISSNSWYGNGQVDAFDAVTHNMENDPQPSPSDRAA
jgi:hypothetical protein